MLCHKLRRVHFAEKADAHEKFKLKMILKNNPMSSRFEVTAPAEADSFEEQKLGTFKSARHLGLTLLHAAKSTLRRHDMTPLILARAGTS